MNILGYSERGAINALLFEIAFSNDAPGLLRRLLDRAIFASCELPTAEIENATVLLEQSLSDFGDADAILLLDRHSIKSAIFIESKVKSSQASDWRLAKEFAAFQKGLCSTLSSSNLFTQLYHKARFIEAARCEGQATLHGGLKFPKCSSKPLRKIGKNPVVLRAVRMVTPYVADVFYLALVPETRPNVSKFVEHVLSPFSQHELDGWDTSRWGFLCWTDVYDFCMTERLETTAAVLEFNRGQIC